MSDKATEQLQRSNYFANLKTYLMEKASGDRKRFLNAAHRQIPKILPIPDVSKCNPGDHVQRDWNLQVHVCSTKYGVDYYKEIVDNIKHEAEDRWMLTGIGINNTEDSREVRHALAYMRSPSSDRFQEMMAEENPNMDETTKAIYRVKAVEVAYNTTQLAIKLKFLEQKRHGRLDSYNVFKFYPEEGYSITMAKGHKMDEWHDAKYRILTKVRHDPGETFWNVCHEDHDVYYSQWLTLSVFRLESMLMMFERVMSLLWYYLRLCIDLSMSDSMLLRQDWIMMPIIMVIEMRSGSSHSCRTNRNIFFSMLNTISHPGKVLESLMDHPIRSRLEAYVRLMQVDWIRKLEEIIIPAWKVSITNGFNSADPPNFMKVPTPFSGETGLDLKVLVADMFLINLFQLNNQETVSDVDGTMAPLTTDKHLLLTKMMRELPDEDNVTYCCKDGENTHTFMNAPAVKTMFQMMKGWLKKIYLETFEEIGRLCFDFEAPKHTLLDYMREDFDMIGVWVEDMSNMSRMIERVEDVRAKDDDSNIFSDEIVRNLHEAMQSVSVGKDTEIETERRIPEVDETEENTSE